LLSLNYMTASGDFSHLSVLLSGLNSAALMLSLINLVLPTGRVLGIDGLLFKPRGTGTPGQQAVFVEEPPLRGPTAPTA